MTTAEQDRCGDGVHTWAIRRLHGLDHRACRCGAVHPADLDAFRAASMANTKAVDRRLDAAVAVAGETTRSPRRRNEAVHRRQRLPRPTGTQARLHAARPRPWWLWRNLTASGLPPTSTVTITTATGTQNFYGMTPSAPSGPGTTWDPPGPPPLVTAAAVAAEIARRRGPTGGRLAR